MHTVAVAVLGVPMLLFTPTGSCTNNVCVDSNVNDLSACSFCGDLQSPMFSQNIIGAVFVADFYSSKFSQRRSFPDQIIWNIRYFTRTVESIMR